MQTNLLWTGREYYSLENCIVNTSEEGSNVNSTFIGLYKNLIYKVEYIIKINSLWETVSAEIRCLHNDLTQLIKMESDGNGNWLINGKREERFSGCIDIDIPLTPFTNSLPVNRLRLTKNQSQEIQVIYIDLLEKQMNLVRQRYTRLSDTQYHYENVPNDFEAKIEVDDKGYVSDYPFLFVRTAVMKSNYL